MSHFHRAEIARMAGWRDRLDLTSNWAITVVAAMLSVSLSTATAHHGVLLFAMLLVRCCSPIEARRYRFFDVYRAGSGRWSATISGRSSRRARTRRELAAAPRRRLAQAAIPDLAPRSVRAAAASQLPLHVMILLLAWILKISTPSLQAGETKIEFVHSFTEAVGNASLGPLPGWIVVLVLALFYLGLLYVAFFTHEEAGEFGSRERSCLRAGGRARETGDVIGKAGCERLGGGTARRLVGSLADVADALPSVGARPLECDMNEC